MINQSCSFSEHREVICFSQLEAGLLLELFLGWVIGPGTTRISGETCIEGADSAKTASDELHHPTPSLHSPSLSHIGPFDQHLGSLDYKPGSVLRLQARKCLVPGAQITPQHGKHCGVVGGQHGAPCRPLQLSSQLSSPPPSSWPPALHSVPGCPLFLPVWNELSPSPHLASPSTSVNTAARPP